MPEEYTSDWGGELANIPADTPPVPLEPMEHLEELAREVVDLKLGAITQISNYDREIRRLRRRVGFLTAIFFLAIAGLGGVLGWIAWRQYQFLDRVAAEGWLDPERVAALEEQIDTLQQQVPGNFGEEFEDVRAMVNELESEVTAVSDEIERRQQAIAALVQALQGLVGEPVPLVTPTRQTDIFPFPEESRPDDAAEEPDEATDGEDEATLEEPAAEDREAPEPEVDEAETGGSRGDRAE